MFSIVCESPPPRSFIVFKLILEFSVILTVEVRPLTWRSTLESGPVVMVAPSGKSVFTRNGIAAPLSTV